MKYYRKLHFLILIFLLGIGSSQIASPTQAQDDSHDGSGDECTTPTTVVSIATDEIDLRFDITELTVPKNDCVKLEYRNLSDLEHDFTLEREDGSQWAHLHLENMLDNSSGFGPGLAKVNLFTPDKDHTYFFYCSVVGHRAAGEEGRLIVGEGTIVNTISDTSIIDNVKLSDEDSLSTGDVQLSFMKYYTAITSFILFYSIRRLTKKNGL